MRLNKLKTLKIYKKKKSKLDLNNYSSYIHLNLFNIYLRPSLRFSLTGLDCLVGTGVYVSIVAVALNLPQNAKFTTDHFSNSLKFSSSK